MFELYLSKTVPLLLYPLGLALTSGLIALLLGLFRKTRGLAWLLALLGVAELWAASTPLAADYLLGSLERYYPPQAVTGYPHVQAIVVLGGGVEGIKPPRKTFDVNASGDRILYAARLYHAGKAPSILVSGGSLPWQEMPAEAAAMRFFLEELGVPARAVLMESSSRNTHEDAAFSKALLEAKNIRKILLVTSAWHMPRAAAVFRKTGLEVVAAPTDYHVVERSRTFFDWLPDAKSLHRSTIAVKEYVGLGYYGLKDRI